MGGETQTELIGEGQCVVLTAKDHEIRDGYVPSRRYVVGKCPDGISSAIMKEKKNLAHQGLLTISGVLNKNDELQGDLRIRALGICVDDGWFAELQPELVRTIHSSARHGDMEEIIRHKAARMIKQSIGRFPTILVDFFVVD